MKLIVTVILILQFTHVAGAEFDHFVDASRDPGAKGPATIKKMIATGKYTKRLDAALLTAAAYSTLEMVRTLVEAGADNLDGALLAAAQGDFDVGRDAENRLEIAKYLVKNGAQVNVRDSAGATALYYASRNGQRLGIWLLRKGADPNVYVGDYRTTPLWEACRPSSVPPEIQMEFVKELTKRGANVNIHGDNGWTPLHLASSFGLTAIARDLLDAGADVNAQDNQGFTPLHSTAFAPVPFSLAGFIPYGDTEAVAELLLRAGADWSMRNNREETAEQVLAKKLPRFIRMVDTTKYPKQAEVLRRWQTEFPKVLAAAKRGEFKNGGTRHKTAPLLKENGKKDSDTPSAAPNEPSRTVTKTDSRPGKTEGNARIYLMLAGGILLLGILFYIRKRKS